jgi:multidrug efflux pump subunit AcrA (membrane-fusion protein)
MSKVTGQSRAKRRNRRIGAGIVLVGVLAGVIVVAVARDDETTATARLVTAAADRGEVTLDVATIGTIEPASTRSLSFEVGGIVASIAVRAGNKVRKGDELARLDNADAAEDVSDAETKLAEARERLAGATGDAVAATASATVCATATRTGGPEVVGARAAVDRTKPAARPEPGPMPEGNGVPIAAAVVAAALNGGPMPEVDGPLAARQPRPAAKPAATGRPVTRDDVVAAATPCATRGFADTGNDQMLNAEQAVNNAELALAQAEEALAGVVMKAPISGTVVSISGSVGDNVKSGSAFLGLADTYAMQISADFPEADAGSLAKGQTGTVTLAGSDEPCPATVIQVDPVGTSDGTLVRYGVLLSFTGAPADLLVGQSAQVRVRTGEMTGVLRVPSTAVHDVAGESGTVQVLSGNAGAGGAERSVTVGLRGDQYTEITDGLSEGEQVVRSW